jgi:hypothetical protein
MQDMYYTLMGLVIPKDMQNVEAVEHYTNETTGKRLYQRPTGM